ncbi:MAG: hypothetical protein CL878_11145 [Dehalococcoidia bacterium]|nr:hypothetical protein [Dehalococcoidia bacterium]
MRGTLSEHWSGELRLYVGATAADELQQVEDAAEIDFSLRGIGFSSTEILPEKARLEVHFPVEGESDSVEIHGKIVSAREEGSPGEEGTASYRYGARFEPGSVTRSQYVLAVLQGQFPRPLPAAMRRPASLLELAAPDRDAADGASEHSHFTLRNPAAAGLQLLAGGDGMADQEPVDDAVDLELSRKGLRFRTYQELPLNSVIQLRLPTEEGGDVLSVRGPVVWSSDVTTQVGGEWRQQQQYGVRFLPDDEEDAARLVAILRLLPAVAGTSK